MEIQQAALSRHIFSKSEDFLRERNLYSYGLAVSLFQDAVELLLWVVAKHVGVSEKGMIPFEDFWKKVKEAPNNKKKDELPYQAEMKELNKARVNFKHYGQLIPVDEANRFHSYTRLFLQDTTKRFFNIDFLSISRADFLKDESLREQVRQVEEEFGKGQYTKCVEECAKMNATLLSSLSAVIPQVGTGFSKGALFRGVSYTMPTNLRQQFHEIGQAVETLGENVYGSIRELRGFTIASIFHVNISDYAKFQRIIPTFYITGRKEQIYHFRHRQHLHTEEDAGFCLNYVIDFALRVQEQVGQD